MAYASFPHRILVVDDNPAIHNDFRKILGPETELMRELNALQAACVGLPERQSEESTVEIDCASGGIEGLEKVRAAVQERRPYSLMYVDVRMHDGWDGIETIRRIWQEFPDLQAVICTAFSDHSWEEIQAILGNSDRFLVLKKPFDPIEIRQLTFALAGRALAERTLLESEEKFRQLAETLETLLENTTDYVYFKDLQSRFVRCSRALGEHLRLPGPEEMIGKTDFDCFTEEHARAAYEDEQEIIRTGKSTIVNLEEKETHRLDGRVTWVLTSKMPWFDKDGNVIGTMGISKNITEHKQLEERLFESQKMETVGRLAGGVAHEFNTLLTAIIGRTELLQSDLPVGSAPSEHAAQIREAADRAAMLTRQLLAYGRRQRLQPETLDLNRLLLSMENMLRHLMGTGVDLRIFPAAHLQAVSADALQMEQVIVNIAINARAAMPSGGKLTLETANVTIDEEIVSSYSRSQPGNYVRVSITDTGTGMSEEVRTRVFEPFFTTKGVGEATGLSLATCQGIINQSGGTSIFTRSPAAARPLRSTCPRYRKRARRSLALLWTCREEWKRSCWSRRIQYCVIAPSYC